MSKKSFALVIASMLLVPIGALAQSGGGAGSGGSAGGAATSSGAAGGAASSAGGAAGAPAAGSPSVAGSSNAGAPGAGTTSISGVPNGQASQSRIDNSINDPGVVGHPVQVPTTPGTNSLGTAQSSGLPSGAGSTVGAAGNRAGASGGRLDGTSEKGPTMQGDAEINAENTQIDKKVKSICKGC